LNFGPTEDFFNTLSDPLAALVAGTAGTLFTPLMIKMVVLSGVLLERFLKGRFFLSF
jgi:hypothetical protein